VIQINGELNTILGMSPAERLDFGSGEFADRAFYAANEILSAANYLRNRGCISRTELAKWKNYRDDTHRVINALVAQDQGAIDYALGAAKKWLVAFLAPVLEESATPIIREAQAKAEDTAQLVHEQSVVPMLLVGLGIAGILGYMALK
jgi:hypothetical protein